MRPGIFATLLALCFASHSFGEERTSQGPFTTRLPTTRLYVSGPWEVEGEFFYGGVVPRHGRPTQFFQTEVEIGLPGRIQIGINEGLVHEPSDRLRHDEIVIETRFAFRELGKDSTQSDNRRPAHRRNFAHASSGNRRAARDRFLMVEQE